MKTALKTKLEAEAIQAAVVEELSLPEIEPETISVQRGTSSGTSKSKPIVEQDKAPIPTTDTDTKSSNTPVNIETEDSPGHEKANETDNRQTGREIWPMLLLLGLLFAAALYRLVRAK